MQNVKIPYGCQQVMPYLIVPGGMRFIDFAKTVFDAVEKEGKHMRDEQTIQHAEITIGNCTIMFADSTPEYLPQTAGLFIYVDDCDIRFKKALEAGATQVMPPYDMPYGRSAGIKDVVANIWWITSI